MTFRFTCFQWGFYDPQMSASIDGTDLVPHDRAVIRAYRSKYTPRVHPSSFFVGDLPPTCTELDLNQLFPLATHIDLIRDIVTRESKGYAFVDGFIDRTTDHRFHEHLLFIEDVASRKLSGWKPRRCGGGLGGRKESGQLRFGGSQRPFRKVSRNPISDQVKQRWTQLEQQHDRIK